MTHKPQAVTTMYPDARRSSCYFTFYKDKCPQLLKHSVPYQLFISEWN